MSPLYILVYAIFYVWTAEIFFFLRDMMDNQCANFFSTHALFIGHIVPSLHLLKERIFFFVCILNFVFKFGLCVFIFPTSKIFPKTCFVFPMFIGGVVSIFYRVKLFCVPLILYFLLTFVAYIFFCFGQQWVGFVNSWQKGGDLDEMWECVGILFVLFRGSWKNIKTFWCI